MTKEMFFPMIAAETQGRAAWNTEVEFRTTIAFLHEVSHLAQDLTTGLGHADYLASRSVASLQLHFAAALMRTAQARGSDVRPPYRCDAGLALVDIAGYIDSTRERLGYLPFDALSHARRERIRGLIAKSAGREISDAQLFELSTQALLESDAAEAVATRMIAGGLTQEQQAIRQKNIALLDRTTLGIEYSAPTFHIATLVEHHFGLDEEQTEGVAARLIGFLIDSALTVPPPELVAAHGQSIDDYDPSVKFSRLLIGLQQVKGAETNELLMALSDTRGSGVERVVLRHMGCDYLTAEAIYAEWLRIFDGQSQESMVADARAVACRYRMNNGVLVNRRDLHLLLAMEVPILHLQQGHGFVKHDWGLRIADVEKSAALTTELLDCFMLDELTEFLFSTAEFRCPLAAADVCPVSEDGCVAGFAHPAQIPSWPDCRARQALDAVGLV